MHHQRLWWIRILALLITTKPALASLPDEIPIAAFFGDSESDRILEMAFRAGVDRINSDPSILPGKVVKPEVVIVQPEKSFLAEQKVCELLSQGVAAVFGPQDQVNSDHLRSVTDVAEVPYIDTRWNYKPETTAVTGHDIPNPQGFDYVINLHLNVNTLGKAYVDLIKKYGWDSVTILYENNNSMMRLKEIFDATSEILYPGSLRLIVRQLEKTPENGYRDVLKEVYSSKSNCILIDCGHEIVGEVLKQAQQVGLISEDYFFMLTSLDAHTVDLEDFKYGGTNFTAFRLVNINKPEVKAVMTQMVQAELDKHMEPDPKYSNLDTNTAVAFDAIRLFALALHEVSMVQDISLAALSCENEDSWVHGSTLINYMKMTEFTGLSGLVQFDTRGLRTHFDLDVLELQQTGLEPIGTWSASDGLNLTRVQEVTEVANPANIMANKTFVVCLILNPPYTMLKEETKKLDGNNRFEGFAIDLMSEIAKFLHFNISFKLVDDGKHGGQDDHGNWNGMIKEVMIGPENGGADFGIADLSVTTSRASAVTFSMPWMNLGISIIYIKPRPAAPSMLSFLSPFTLEVWIYTAFGYVFVSLVMFVLARFSPHEWRNPYPCIEEPEELENQFSLANSFWFTIGSLMQQGSDVAPISVSTRLLAGMWFFFALIMIASYTANLAAFLTVETLEKPIESAEDLADQTDIKYGVVEGGSTMNFFKTSTMPTYQKMWKFMSGIHRQEVMVSKNEVGIEKVVQSDGKYAFMMESSSIQYIIERNCKLTQIGGNLDTKGYGIAMAQGTPYKPPIDSAILHLQENGALHKLKVKWWKQKRGGGACVGDSGEGGVAELGLPNVLGVFIVTLIGCGCATLLAVFEFFYGTKQQADDLGTTWITEIKEELRFAFKCFGSTKTLRRPVNDDHDENDGAAASSHSGTLSSLEKAGTSKPRRASLSSAENPYAKFNGSGRKVLNSSGNPFESDRE